MLSLWQEWGRLLSRIDGARHLLILSDYDGTLTPIAPRPELALMPPPMKVILSRLAVWEGGTVAIVSGRALEDVRALIGIEGIYYAGNHGLEIEGPGFRWVHPEAGAIMPLLEDLARELSASLGEVRGVIVENKGLTLSVHYRMVAPEQAGQVRAVFEATVEPMKAQGKLMVTGGKMVCEARPPVDWDKGKAVDFLVTKVREVQGIGEVLPFFLGDDFTDEAGFHAVRKSGGVSIFVSGGDHESGASYSVDSIGEVQRFLVLLLEAGQGPTRPPPA